MITRRDRKAAANRMVDSRDSYRTAVLQRVERLAARGALDGADNPVQRLVEALRDAQMDIEPRPVSDPAVGTTAVLPTSLAEPAGTGTPSDYSRDGSSDTGEPSDAVPPSRGRRGGIKMTLLMMLAFAGDVANLYMALSVVGNAEPWVTALVVLALACTALGLGHRVGRIVRDRVEQRTVPRWAIPALTAPVLLLGLCAAGVRLAAPISDDSGAGAFGVAETSLLSPTAVNVVLTLLLFVLFVASVTLAALLGYDSHDPAAQDSNGWSPGRWALARLDLRRRERARRRAVRRVRTQAEAEEKLRIDLARHWHRGQIVLRESEIAIAEHCGDARRATVLTHLREDGAR